MKKSSVIWDKVKFLVLKFTKMLNPLAKRFLELTKSVWSVLKREFKKASDGKMTLNEVLLKWGLSSLLVFWFVFRNVRFLPILVALMIYFMWNLYVIQKCSPKLTKEEKEKIREAKKNISKEEKHELKKQKKKDLVDKVMLRKPWREFNSKRAVVVLDLLVILELLRKILMKF